MNPWVIAWPCLCLAVLVFLHNSGPRQVGGRHHRHTPEPRTVWKITEDV